MTKEQFARRFLPFQADISATLVRDFRDASEDDSQRVLQAAETMLPWPLWVHDPDGMEGSELTTMARALIRNHKIQLVIVDYLQVIQGDGNDLRARVSAVSNRLRSLAKTEQVAVLALSQLRRPDSEDTRPTMFHLKESGDIEAHAHTVILLYRPKDEDGQWTGEDEIIIGKQREGLVGRTGVVLDQRRLIFRPRT
jgi:replicative DNA helicase